MSPRKEPPIFKLVNWAGPGNEAVLISRCNLETCKIRLKEHLGHNNKHNEPGL